MKDKLIKLNYYKKEDFYRIKKKQMDEILKQSVIYYYDLVKPRVACYYKPD